MSNLDRVAASYRAFEAGDLEGALRPFADDVVWEQAEGLPHGGVYRGLDEVRLNVFAPLRTSWWSEFHAVPAELLEAGEHVVALGRYTGRARGTGRPLDVPFVHVWTFAAGRAVRFRQFLDTRGWVAALS